MALPIPRGDKLGTVEIQQVEFYSWRSQIAGKLRQFGIKDVYVFVVDHKSAGAKLDSNDKLMFQDSTYKLLRCDLTKG
jgi:hypothetical protein